MKKALRYLLPIIAIAAIGLVVFNKTKNNNWESEEEEEYDGPEKIAELAYRKTLNPFTGKVDRQKMWDAIVQTNQLKQTNNSTSGLTWVERGSFTDAPGPSGNSRPAGAVTSGRMRAVWPDLADPTGKTVWVGGVDGGIWKTNDITAATPAWTPANDFLSNLAVTGICQDPTNTNTMYFCTGEAFFNGDAVFGNGVFKSTDHGVTWVQLASTTALTRCSKILCDALGNVYVSTIGISVAVGLQRSTNGGTSWTSINPFTTTSRIVDFEISSTGAMHVSAGLSSAAGVGGYRYTASPATATTTTGWNQATALFTWPTGTSSRTELACNGTTVYAALATTNTNSTSSIITAIAKSTDGGDTWTTTTLPTATVVELNGSSTTGGQGWYSIGLGVDPSNANNVIVGSLNLIRSQNGGSTFTKISDWFGTTVQYVHADIHNITWYDNGNKCLVGCDGGIFISSNSGTSWADKNVNLRLKQFYSVAIHPTLTNYFLAGAQDNGTHQFNGAGLTSSIEVTGGDGAYVDIDQNESQYQFGAYVFNQYRRSTNNGANWSSINFSSSAGEFINPFDYDDVGNMMYCCYNANQYLRWDNPQTGSTFTPVSMTNFNGGLAEAITVSPYTPNRVFFGTNTARIVRADDANTATPVETNITPTALTGFVNSITIGSSDQNLIASVTSTGTTNVWLTTDGGTTWSACDGNLPDLPVYSAVFHPDNGNKAFISTEAGVWFTDALNGASTVWVPENTFPTVKTEMLRYRSSDRTLAAATHGRGLWTATIPSGCTTASISAQPVNAAGCTTANVSFSITATSTSLQWQESTNGGTTWNNIANGGIYGGATTNTLTLTGITIGMNNYLYRCVVIGSCSPTPVNSNQALLTVSAGANITAQPTAGTICAGQNTTFTITATGTSLTYQWQVSTDGGATYTNITNGGVYAGATTNALSITAATGTMTNYRYRCVVTSSCGNLNSNAGILTVNTAPAITTQPANTGVCTGNNVTFTIAATGTAASYQWQESTNGGTIWNNIANGGIYSGVTTASLTLTGVTIATNNNQYRCVVNGTCTPAATSTAAILTVSGAFIINTQPANTVVCAGSNANYSTAVSGTVTYQWQESTNGGTTWTNITNGGIYSNATTATLTITGATAGMSSYLYRCVVSGTCPTVNTNSASLTVNTAPSIVTQPAASNVICTAQNASFTVGASGTGVTYQWQVSTDGGTTFANIANGGVYSNVTTPTINITAATAAMNNYRYRCVVGGTCTPAATSNASILTVNTPVSITTNPANSLICENSNTAFTVAAGGTTPSYQWQVSTNGGTSFTNITNGGIYAGATTATLTLSGVAASFNNYQYRCVVNGAAPCGNLNSNAAVLTISNAPAAFTVAGGGSYCSGGTGVAVNLSNSATGFSYQLQLNGVNSGAPLAGTGGALNFGLKTAPGVYTVIATNNTTSCTSAMPGNATVVLYAQPSVTLSASATRVLPGVTATVSATVTSGTAPFTYTWFQNNISIGNNSNSYSVNITNMGTYRVNVTDANGCAAQSQVITIADSASGKLFIYPSPNDGRFNVVYYSSGGTTDRTLAIFNDKGQKVYYNKFSISQPYQIVAIDLRRNGAGVYYVVLGDAAGNKLKTGEVLVR